MCGNRRSNVQPSPGVALTTTTTTTGNRSYNTQVTDDNDDDDDDEEYVNIQESQMTDKTRGAYHDQFAMYEMSKRSDSKPRPSIVNKNRKSLMPQ